MLKMRKYIHVCLLIIGVNLLSCEKFLEPKPDGTLTEDEIITSPGFAEGLLLTAYYNLPAEYDFSTDVACDDAVTNEKGSAFREMATGNWKSSNDPISMWTSSYEQIYYINKFLEIYTSVRWANDLQLSQEENDLKDELHKKRLKGEAHALRAWYKYQLLQHHAGKSADGRLLGFPVIDKVIEQGADWKLPRNTFAQCVTSIFTDLDTAIANLPAEWVDGSEEAVKITSGKRFENRINGNTARALKSRVALLAASPAFSASNAVSWEEAATIAGDLLETLGDLYSKGNVFYKEISSREILWNRSKVQSRNREENNFPPSLFGYGRTNPSQNLVDAFPMKNGYPIDHDSSGYDPENPYMDRDPRLYNYVIFNDAAFKSTPINTYIGASQDGINSLETSTRTGYYLKKLMAEGVVLTPGSPVDAVHNYTYVRMTEVLLNYCEAANEAWGPEGDPNGYGFTALSKMAELRGRAGLAPDDYLASVTDQAGLRELIRNERRLELCFEGFRFWDIRRWDDLATMTAPVRGVYITFEADSTFSYSYSNIENRVFTPDMIYGPVPYEETLKYDLEQNAGW
jgi:hypothetical protein